MMAPATHQKVRKARDHLLRKGCFIIIPSRHVGHDGEYSLDKEEATIAGQALVGEMDAMDGIHQTSGYAIYQNPTTKLAILSYTRRGSSGAVHVLFDPTQKDFGPDDLLKHICRLRDRVGHDLPDFIIRLSCKVVTPLFRIK